jgi:hypothetical protein
MLAVLGLPGEALAHHLDLDQIGEAREQMALAGVAAALDELHHTELAAMAEAAHGQAPRRRALALARPGVDDQQTLLDRLGRVDPVLGRLDPGHLLTVRLVYLGFGCGHGCLPHPSR